MPRIFRHVESDELEKEVHKDYFDRHSPFILCDSQTQKGEKFRVKVRLGKDYSHPDDADHFISFIQLWNRETLLAQVNIAPGAFGNQPAQTEVDFYIIPKVSMNLTAMSNCTKHGLWVSDPVEVKVI